MIASTRIRRGVLWVLGAAVLGTTLAAVPAQAQYSQLQVLLPGESPAPGTATGKSGTPLDQTVGISFEIRVRACDADWNTMTGVTNLVSFGSTDESASLPSSMQLSAGELTASVTLNAGGSFTISATDETDGSIQEAVSAAITTFVLHGFDFDRINQKNQYAGVPMSITVYAVDPQGNVVTGYNGPVALRQLTSFGVGRISPAEVTLSAGTWSGDVANYRADETNINRGNVNIEAYLPSSPATNGISDPFVVHPGPFSRVQIVVPGESPWPGSVSGVNGTPANQASGQLFSVGVYSTDDYWNPVPSADVVRVTSSDPGATTPVSGPLSDGFVSLDLALGTVGPQTLTVTDQTNGSIAGMTSAPIAVIAAGAHHFLFDPIPSPLVAGDPVTITIRAVDAGENTIPDFEGDAYLSANTGPGSISPVDVTFTNGIWTGDVSLRGAGGAVSVTCSDFAAPPHTGSSNPVVVQPGPYTALQVLVPGESPQGGTLDGVSGTPDDQAAGTPFDLRIRAVDAFFNLVPGIGSRIALSSTDALAAMPSDTTLTNGELILPVTLFKAGQQTFTATDEDSTGITPSTSSEVTVTPGLYSRILVVAPGEEIAPGAPDGRSGTATDQSIDFAFTVTVYATDQWFNPMPGATDVIRLTCTDPLATLPSDTPMIDGQVDMVVRLATGGFQQITATNLTQPGMETSTTQVRGISSGFHLEAEVNPTGVQAGEPFTLNVRVVNDAGAVMQEINSFVTVEAQHASTGDPGRGSLFTTEFQLLQGQRSVQETYTFAEPIVLIVRDDAGNDPAVTEVVTVTPGAPSAVQLSSNPTWVRGNARATVTARVVDQYDNGVPLQPVVFSLISGGGILTPISPETDDDGDATADFQSAREPGFSLVRANASGFTADLYIETALVDPNMPDGEVTTYPNPFHPGEVPTTIAYKLSDDSTVRLRIYTLSGGLVYDEEFAASTPGGRAGLNQFTWDGKNGAGRLISSGTYILLIEAKGAGETQHVIRHKMAAVR